MSPGIEADRRLYRLRVQGVCAEGLTGGEAGPLVTARELDVEVGDQRVDVVVPLHLQAERRGEGQVVDLHRVDVYLLCGGIMKERRCENRRV